MQTLAHQQSRTCCALALEEVSVDDFVRARSMLEPNVVAHYSSLLQASVVLPPILVYNDGDHVWLVDGSHRLAAHREAGLPRIVAEVRAGTRDDAIWAACAVNQTHGLRRTNADKHRSVERALLHPQGQRLSNRQIARHCGVHHHSVGRIRSELEASNRIAQISKRVVERQGAIYEHETRGIATANAARISSVVTACAEHQRSAASAPTVSVQIDSTVERLSSLVLQLEELRRDVSSTSPQRLDANDVLVTTLSFLATSADSMQHKLRRVLATISIEQSAEAS